LCGEKSVQLALRMPLAVEAAALGVVVAVVMVRVLEQRKQQEQIQRARTVALQQTRVLIQMGCAAALPSGHHLLPHHC
jgi:hypothetical protein